jgi:pyridoxal phosphate enzyme (YggS family)
MTEFDTATIRDNIQKLQESVSSIAAKHGRNSRDIRSVLVTKYQSVEKINAAIKFGTRDLAENYPEMLISKLSEIDQVEHLTWHMIGHIQSRKANLVVDHFSYVHSIDSIKIANRLNMRATEKSCILPILIEINIGNEKSKSGYPVNTKGEYNTLVENLDAISKCDHLKINGLMTMPPFTEEPENSRIYFQECRKLLDKINNDMPMIQLSELSMGTSQDYQVAIEEGATLIRIGTLVFGDKKW